MKPFKRYFIRWFLTRPVLRFGLVVAGVLLGRMLPEYFWPGVAVLALGSLLHLWAKGCLRQYRVLTICGPYRFVRHPFYLSYLVIDIGVSLLIANLYVAAVYFPIWLAVYYLQIRREELKLLELYGKAYADYRHRVPALLPCRLPAPCAEGQSFSWSNPNITRRSEIPRLMRLALFPAFFFLAYRVRESGADFLYSAGQAEMFALFAVIAFFFFARLLNPAIKRRRRMLPRWLESYPLATAISIGIGATAHYTGYYLPLTYWYLWILTGAILLAAFLILLIKKFIPYLSMMFFCCTVAIAWQNYWLIPVAAFYHCACCVDVALFPFFPVSRKEQEKPQD